MGVFGTTEERGRTDNGLGGLQADLGVGVVDGGGLAGAGFGAVGLVVVGAALVGVVRREGRTDSAACLWLCWRRPVEGEASCGEPEGSGRRASERGVLQTEGGSYSTPLQREARARELEHDGGVAGGRPEGGRQLRGINR